MALALCFSIGSLKIVLFFDLPEYTVRDKANPENREIGHFSRSNVTKYTIHKCPFFFLVFTETWFSWITLESLFYRDCSFSHDLNISDSGNCSVILLALHYHCQALLNTLLFSLPVWMVRAFSRSHLGHLLNFRSLSRQSTYPCSILVAFWVIFIFSWTLPVALSLCLVSSLWLSSRRQFEVMPH